MAVVYTADVFCDHAPSHAAGMRLATCTTWVRGYCTRNSKPLARDARDEAAAAGWARRHGPSSCAYDLCPEHAAEVPGETFPDWKARVTGPARGRHR
jgi:hypothetical protein